MGTRSQEQRTSSRVEYIAALYITYNTTILIA